MGMIALTVVGTASVATGAYFARYKSWTWAFGYGLIGVAIIVAGALS